MQDYSSNGESADVRLLKRGTFPRGVRKYALTAGDSTFEAVARKEEGGLSVSFSSQVGCAVGCSFCATGLQGFNRNLTEGEMIAQIEAVVADVGGRLVRVEASAQGEPLLNVGHLVPVLERYSRLLSEWNDALPRASGIGLCTCGVVGGIECLSDCGTSVDLKVSLHSADQKMRDTLMPGAARWPLSRLKRALSRYCESGTSVTLTWALMKGVNDDARSREALARFCGDLPCSVSVTAMKVDGGIDGEVGLQEARSYADALAGCGIAARVCAADPPHPVSVKLYPR